MKCNIKDREKILGLFYVKNYLSKNINNFNTLFNRINSYFQQSWGPGAEPLCRFEGVEGGESKLPLRFATFAIKSRPARQGTKRKCIG